MIAVLDAERLPAICAPPGRKSYQRFRQLPGLPPENELLTPTELDACGRSNSQSLNVVSIMKCFLSGFEAVLQPASQFAVSKTEAPVSEPPLKRT